MFHTVYVLDFKNFCYLLKFYVRRHSELQVFISDPQTDPEQRTFLQSKKNPGSLCRCHLVVAFFPVDLGIIQAEYQSHKDSQNWLD